MSLESDEYGEGYDVIVTVIVTVTVTVTVSNTYDVVMIGSRVFFPRSSLRSVLCFRDRKCTCSDADHDILQKRSKFPVHLVSEQYNMLFELTNAVCFRYNARTYRPYHAGTCRSSH